MISTRTIRRKKVTNDGSAVLRKQPSVNGQVGSSANSSVGSSVNGQVGSSVNTNCQPNNNIYKCLNDYYQKLTNIELSDKYIDEITTKFITELSAEYTISNLHYSIARTYFNNEIMKKLYSDLTLDKKSEPIINTGCKIIDKPVKHLSSNITEITFIHMLFIKPCNENLKLIYMEKLAEYTKLVSNDEIVLNNFGINNGAQNDLLLVTRIIELLLDKNKLQMHDYHIVHNDQCIDLTPVQIVRLLETLAKKIWLNLLNILPDTIDYIDDPLGCKYKISYRGVTKNMLLTDKSAMIKADTPHYKFILDRLKQ